MVSPRRHTMRRHSKRSPGLKDSFDSQLDKAKSGGLGLGINNNGNRGQGNPGNGNSNNDRGNQGGGNDHGQGGDSQGNQGGRDGQNNGNDNPAPGGNADPPTPPAPPAPVSPPSQPTSSNGENSGSSSANGPSDSSQDSRQTDQSPSPTTVSVNVGNPGAPSTYHTDATSTLSPAATVSATVASGGTSPSAFAPLTSPHVPSSSSTTVDTTSHANLGSQSNRGAIAGGIVGALVFVFLAFAAWIVYKRRRKNRLPPSAEFLDNSSAYPFARTGIGNTANNSEKSGAFGGNYGGAGTDAAGQANFKPFSTDSAEGMFSEKESQMGRFRDKKVAQPSPKPPQPEVLYSTPVRVTTPSNAPGSAPGTPTTPNRRRVPFGTGTFQFPPKRPQPKPHY